MEETKLRTLLDFIDREPHLDRANRVNIHTKVEAILKDEEIMTMKDAKGRAIVW